MTDLDHALASALREHADDAPTSIGLLDAVHTRRRRARRRRLALAGAATAAVVAAAGLSAAATRDPADDRLQVTAPAPGRNHAPPSPVDVGWLPTGFSSPTVSLYRPGLWLIRTAKERPHANLSIEIGSARPPERTAPGTLRRVTVGSTPATLYSVPPHPRNTPPFNQPPESGGPYAELVFQRTPTRWVRIVAWNGTDTNELGISTAEMIRIGAALVDRDRSVADLFRFRTVPEGLQVCVNADPSEAGTAYLSFCDAATATAAKPEYPMADGFVIPAYAIGVMYAPRATGTDRPQDRQDRKRIAVDGRTVEIARERTGASARGWYARVELPGGRAAEVQVRDASLLTEGEFTAFVLGMSAGEDLGR